MKFFKNNIGLSLFFVFFAISFCGSQPIDIADHPFPIADGFADPAPEGLLPNPALLTSFPNGWASAEHERLFWGFGEPLQRSGFNVEYNSCCSINLPQWVVLLNGLRSRSKTFNACK